MKISGIYKIQSKIKPERIYIGSAVNVKGRWRVHLHTLRNNKHHSKKLQRHFNKYGESDLIFIIIETCLVEFLIVREQFYLDNNIAYFNNSKIAGSPLGVKRSKKFCKENSERLKGRIFSEETRKRISEAKKLQVVSEETRKKLSKASKNRIVSEEIRRKISEANKGEKNGFYGKHHSEETRIKFKNRVPYNKGLKLSEEHKRKIGESKIGKKRKPFSIECRKKMSDSHKKLSA